MRQKLNKPYGLRIQIAVNFFYIGKQIRALLYYLANNTDLTLQAASPIHAVLRNAHMRASGGIYVLVYALTQVGPVHGLMAVFFVNICSEIYVMYLFCILLNQKKIGIITFKILFSYKYNINATYKYIQKL